MKMGTLRGSPPTLTRHQLELGSHRPDDDRLQHAARGNRGGKLSQRRFVEVTARLIRGAARYRPPRSCGYSDRRYRYPGRVQHPQATQTARAPAQAICAATERLRRPHSCGHRSFGQTPDQFARQCHIGLRAGATNIVDECRQPVAWRLGKPNVTRDDRLEDDLPQTGANVFGNLLGQPVTPIIHGQCDAEDRQARIKLGPDPVRPSEEAATALRARKIHTAEERATTGRRPSR